MAVHTLPLLKHMTDYTELDAMREDYLRYLYTLPPHETIQRMVDYTTRLQQVLISEGYTTNYTPTWDEYSQKVTVQLKGVDGGIGHTTGITVNVFRLAIINLLPEESDISVHTVGDAVAALEGAITRWRAHTFQRYVENVLIWWKHPMTRKWEDAVWDQCLTCYYSCGDNKHCGMGLVKDVGCTHHVPREAIG